MSNPISPKVTAAAAAAAVVTILTWILRLAGIELPGEVQGAATTLLVLAAGYVTPDKLRNALLAAEEPLEGEESA